MPVRPAKNGDLFPIAAIHKSQFESHFLGQYSTTLLRKYYGIFLGKVPFFVHEAAEGVDGFLLGGSLKTLGERRSAFVRENLLRCLWETLLHPRLWLASWRRGLRHINPFRRARTGAKGASPGSDINVLSIAVSKKAMGTGVAAMLIAAFEREIQDGRGDHYGLSVVKENLRACRFYEKIGFEVVEDNGTNLVLQKRLTVPNGALSEKP
ncbi:MAG: GNAT family N-acetyltransferase [Pirellulales bacterium]|nr:GNAT family N-acetyltransferase [Pirellulales bacterium]